MYTGQILTAEHPPAERIGAADEADCDDVGEDAAGSVFPAEPKQVTVWSFANYDASEVVGVKFGGNGMFHVYVLDSLPQKQADSIARTFRSA